MNTISFMTANYVARQIGYNMTGGWGQGDNSSNDHFRPIETFGERLEVYLKDIRAMGFEALDMWTGVMNPDWATGEHKAIAHDLLAKHNLKVVSIAGGFGQTPAQFDAACRLAVALGTDILGGTSALLLTDRPSVVEMLTNYGVKLAIENHPEKTPEEVLVKIGDGGGGTIGAAVDTGIFAMQGYDPVQAIEKLKDHLLHIHLKDARDGESCRFGDGEARVEECVYTLKRLSYSGAITVEHEPSHGDPTDDVKASFEMLKGWLQ